MKLRKLDFCLAHPEFASCRMSLSPDLVQEVAVAQPLEDELGGGLRKAHRILSKYLKNEWCRRGESNPRPRDYETLALPLSYAGLTGNSPWYEGR